MEKNGLGVGETIWGIIMGLSELNTTHFATCDRRTEWVVADTDFLVDNAIGKVVFSPSHGTDKDRNIVSLWEGRQVFG